MAYAFFDHNAHAVSEAWNNGWSFTPLAWDNGAMMACIGSTWIYL